MVFMMTKNHKKEKKMTKVVASASFFELLLAKALSIFNTKSFLSAILIDNVETNTLRAWQQHISTSTLRTDSDHLRMKHNSHSFIQSAYIQLLETTRKQKVLFLQIVTFQIFFPAIIECQPTILVHCTDHCKVHL